MFSICTMVPREDIGLDGRLKGGHDGRGLWGWRSQVLLCSPGMTLR